MSGKSTAPSRLTWDVLAVRRRGLTRGLPHAPPDRDWVANTATLISGRRHAVLVDTFLTREQSRMLVDWVVRSGKELIAVYVTHGHGDHFFGLAPLLDRFPQARPLATPAVVSAMRDQVARESRDNFWRALFPGQIPDRLVVAEPLTAEGFDLDGEQLLPINTGHTDTAASTSLHVPSLDLIVAGDVVYNGIHPYLGETNIQSRHEWLAALDKLAALRPRVVVAGHKVPENEDDPSSIASTQRYLRDFNRLDQVTTTALDLYEAMLDLYPDRANPGALWKGANTAKKASSLRH